MLVIMYINDLTKHVENSHVSLYADDTALYVQAKTQIEVMLDLRVELAIMSKWLRANKLALNMDKTKYLIFGSRQMLIDKPDLNLMVNGKKIERVPVMKYSGMLLDEHLTYCEHVD